MATLVEELAQQALRQTRVLSNGPVLGVNEPLRVDVVPGGAPGAQSKNDALDLALGASNPLAVFEVTASFAISKDNTPMPGGTYIEIPTVVSGPPNLLSRAFQVAPKIKLTKGGTTAPTLPSGIGLPMLDHKLTVTISVESSALEAPISRAVEIPFTVPTIEVPLPVVPGVCICAQDTNLTGAKHLVMVPPGAPSSVAEIAATYNSVLDAFNSLETVLSLLSFVVKPLDLVVSTLATITTPYVTTNARVQDFDDFDDFDDEMTSCLIVAPTGYGVRFSDTANPGDWDDTGDNGMVTYRVIDLLQLPNDPEGVYMLGKLGMDAGKVSDLAAQVATLTAVPATDVKLGIGVFYVHDLTSKDTPKRIRHYETPGDTKETVNDDTESAMWITG